MVRLSSTPSIHNSQQTQLRRLSPPRAHSAQWAAPRACQPRGQPRPCQGWGHRACQPRGHHVRQGRWHPPACQGRGRPRALCRWAHPAGPRTLPGEGERPLDARVGDLQQNILAPRARAGTCRRMGRRVVRQVLGLSGVWVGLHCVRPRALHLLDRPGPPCCPQRTHKRTS